MVSSNEQFAEAANYWDLETLYNDLASEKCKRLTQMEKLHLRGLLLGYSPAEIADKLKKDIRGVEADLCATLYRYVKGLVGKSDEKMDNWRNVTNWLEEAGYKTEETTNQRVTDFLPVDIIGKIASIKFCKKRITIEIDTIEVDLSSKNLSPTEDS